MSRIYLALILLLTISVSGCTAPQIPSNGAGGPSGHPPAESRTSQPQGTPPTIRIASWNIENFGRSKATDEMRMKAIADTLDGYDIIAVQEISKVREPDMIILGDLNADCDYLKPSDVIGSRAPDYIWVVNDDSDTTIAGADCAYDRFIFKNATSEDFTGNSGIYKDIADDVSDHYLIWAEFWTGKDSR